MTAQTDSSPAESSEELARFRKAWKEEVRRKKAAAVGPSKAAGGGCSEERSLEVLPQASVHPAQNYHPIHASRVTDTTSAPVGPKLQRAVEVYRRAALCEQQSNLDEALELYRIAFRMDPNIEAQFYAKTTVPSAEQPAQATSSAKRDPVDEVTHGLKASDIHTAVVPAKEGGDAVPQDSLASIMAEWPHDLQFLPEDEQQSVEIQKLPVEVLLVVLRKLNTTTLERFALVSRKARVLTLDMSIWREFVEAIYKPPQLRDMEELDTVYIEHPRVRLDGVYIAICHYTYVHVLSPNRAGSFQVVLYDGGGIVNAGAADTTYDAGAALAAGGRWNRLNFLAYDSVNIESGEVSPVPLKHDRGFHFSKVRSYA
ncbi:uncharacterized protein B0H18DRAFT_1047136 [Fomitopsis serialis]|uniref:uncharacterized protein n=1 Tax=Fomitopsis serialis TaxID=139415 RepID=UPI0020072B0C|nr:uncharacterized protein B0H18DRAFT_1047136 [Neoantrodia serialis]KAH9913927.1 hypothetical protein B0H18DRAFT_1047136 [Neoantrodia serialis]